MLDASGQTGLIYEPFNPVLEKTGLCTAPFKGFTYVHSGNEADFELPIARTLSYDYDWYAALRTMHGLRGSRKRLREWRNARDYRHNRLRPLMKDPIAVFSAEWLAERFDMSVLVLIRHPAAFVASIVRLGWTHNFQEFLDQECLMRDHLEPFRAEIEEFARVEHDVLDQAALAWKLIHHMISGYRARHAGWLFVNHEELSLRPLEGYERIYDTFGLHFGDEAKATVDDHTRRGNDEQAPDGVATHLKRDSAASLDGWRRRLSEEEMLRVRKRVEPVSSDFYDASTWTLAPQHDAL